MTKFCPECGFKQHNDNNRYCSNCGFDFSKLEEIGSNSNSSDSLGINAIDDSEDASINVPITDLEDSEDSKPFTSEPSHSVSHVSVDSKPAGSSSGSSVDSKPVGSSSSSSADSKPKNTVSKSSSNSNREVRTDANQKTKSKKSSDFTFNKCFGTFAAFLIIIVIFGLITQAFPPEPYSDGGITSFMERSNSYDLNDFLEETSNENDYYTDYDDILRNGAVTIKYFPLSK